MTTPDPHPFAARLKEWIQSWQKAGEGRSQASLARTLSIEPSAVTHWMNGDGKPGLRTLAALCRALGLTVEEAREAYRLCGVELGPVLDEAEGAAK